jgi:hypothetical protein
LSRHKLRRPLASERAQSAFETFQGSRRRSFFSMATSSGENAPRNLEFLLSRNRLNVAVSRAKCLAHVVASPKLLEVGCRSIEQTRMANALCLFVESRGASHDVALGSSVKGNGTLCLEIPEAPSVAVGFTNASQSG